MVNPPLTAVRELRRRQKQILGMSTTEYKNVRDETDNVSAAKFRDRTVDL